MSLLKLYQQEPLVFEQIGQIDIDTQAGRKIIETFIQFKPRKILEIGTWNGLGTTRCILFALKNFNQDEFDSFISLECNTIKHSLALKNNEGLLNSINKEKIKVKLLNATILDESDWKEAREMFNKEIKEDWFTTDYEHSTNVENIYSQLSTIDALLLDGGEYTTYQEYKKLLPICTKLILLDDVNACKCSKIKAELLQNKDWNMIYHTEERNGFTIFQKL